MTKFFVKVPSLVKVGALLVAFSLLAVTQSSCTRKKTDSGNEEIVINSAIAANVKGLDPIDANDTYSSGVISQIYETLLHYHYLKRPLTLQPLLATEMPTASADGLTHTIKIKPGVMFHDDECFPNGKGRELTAEDFVYSWKRLADPKNNALGFWVFDKRIEGLNEWRTKVGKGEADYSTPVSGLQAPDKYTIVIKLTQPYYQLYYVLAMPYTSPVPKEAVEKYGKEIINHPVGTGPFKFDSWIRNSRIELVRNPNWRNETYPTDGEASDTTNGFLADAGKKIPFVDRVVMHEIVQEQPRWLKFMKGELDFSSIPKDNFETAIQDDKLSKEFAAKGIELFVVMEPDVTYTAFNMLDPILGKNEKLRKAISMATDVDSVIKKFFNGRAISAQSPIPPGVDAYDAKYKNPYKEFNVEKAKQLLAEAGFPGGKGLPELEFSTVSSTTSRQMAEFFKQNMAQIGVKVSIATSSWPQFQDKIHKKKAQIWGVAWLADYPDAENFLQLLYGPNTSPGPNGSNFDDSKFNKLYEKAALLPPGPERTDLYHQMRDIVVSEAPWVMGMHRMGYSLRHQWVKNYKPHPIISDGYKYFRVEGSEKAKMKAKL